MIDSFLSYPTKWRKEDRTGRVGWMAQDKTGQNGLNWTGLDWIGEKRTGMDRIGQDRTGRDQTTFKYFYVVDSGIHQEL